MEPTKRKDGRYVTTITQKGKKKYIYGRSKAECKRNANAYLKKQADGELFGIVSDDWWEEHEDELSIQSRRGYLRAKKLADAEFADILIKDITPKDINHYFKTLSNSYSNQKTFNKFRQVLNQIFAYAVQEEYIDFNPCAAAKSPKNLIQNKRRSASSDDERRVKESKSTWLLPFFALHSGMRKGEILALQWKDIDFDEDLISVTKSVAHDGDRPIIKEPKTEAGNRYVPLLNPLKQRLLEVKDKYDENDYIFSDDGSKPLTNRRYITLMKQYREETGISCGAHQLRHSFATIAFENGLEAKFIQEILGHKQLATTMDTYTDIRKKGIKNTTKKLNSFFEN